MAVISCAILSAILALPAVQGAAQDSRVVTDAAAAMAVGLGTLIMVATNTEHPPAAGTALGLVISPWSWSAIVFVLSSAIVLSVVWIALRPWLVNLL